MSKIGYVYILTSKRNGTLYIGVTSDLLKRTAQHRQKVVDGFTKTYDVKRLVYFEQFVDIRDAILREKQMKKWKRAWKVRLVEEENPEWVDLWSAINGFPPARE